MKLSAAVLVLAVAAATPALAQEATPAESPSQPWATRPGKLDVRITSSTTSVLLYVGVGLNADYSLLALGPATLALGGQLDWSVCALDCLATQLATGRTTVERVVTPSARVTLHVPFGGVTLGDVYLLANAGVLIGNRTVQSLPNAYLWHASAYGPAFSGGIGSNFFFGSGFFAGAEVLFTYSAYRYVPIFDSGTTTPTEQEVAGGGPNPQLKLALGFRF